VADAVARILTCPHVRDLRLEPRPLSRELAARSSDWMFLNGGPPAKIAAIVADVRKRAASLDRRERTRGAQGMWASPGADPLAELDSNEGFASRLCGAPDTILARMREFASLGIDCFHLALVDERFNREVLPRLNEAR
jgi:alkanesulfonate monooxygenase SsuD/methylene tetrahydromethanopterin reductase-like flavin-dependent oxidoreductase (luciferase family)